MTDTLTILGAALGSGGLGAVVARYAVPPIASWLRHREKGRAQVAVSDREADAAEAVAQMQHDATVAPPLLDRIKDLERRTDECHEQRERDREEHARQRRTDREDCERYTAAQVERATAPLRDAIATMGRVLREDTGVHHLDAVIARVSTPVPARPKTMLPPSGGEEE